MIKPIHCTYCIYLMFTAIESSKRHKISCILHRRQWTEHCPWTCWCWRPL